MRSCIVKFVGASLLRKSFQPMLVSKGVVIGYSANNVGKTECLELPNIVLAISVFRSLQSASCLETLSARESSIFWMSCEPLRTLTMQRHLQFKRMMPTTCAVCAVDEVQV